MSAHTYNIYHNFSKSSIYCDFRLDNNDYYNKEASRMIQDFTLKADIL